MEPENTPPGKGKSSSKPSFSGSMLNFGRVCHFIPSSSASQVGFIVDNIYVSWSIKAMGCTDNTLETKGVNHPAPDERLEHHIMEVFVEDDIPFFSWVMAVGEPAVNLPG